MPHETDNSSWATDPRILLAETSTTLQYDFDTATVFGFLKHFGLENEVKVNLEANRALLDGKLSMETIAAQSEAEGLNPLPRSGRLERLENLVSGYF